MKKHLRGEFVTLYHNQQKNKPKLVIEMKIKLPQKDGTFIEIEPDNIEEFIEIIQLLNPDSEILKHQKKEYDPNTLSYRIINALKSSWGNRARNLREIADYIDGDYNPVSGVLTYLHKKGELGRIGEMRNYHYFLSDKKRLILNNIEPPSSPQHNKNRNIHNTSGKKKTQIRQILDVLEGGGRPMYAREIVRELPHIEPEKVFRALANMFRRNKIRREGRPMNYRYYI